ncbi:MAG: glycine cleavage system aminomethyltransferase GcvT, partial [Nitrososphaerota archaeon]|nr:glycine cleavage system aminomethyltransferase GcvT [Nitrososphaerota archaeon]
MANKSHLYEYHMRHGKITDFAGFDMPLWYTSIIDEHMAVRNAAGLFDVSHMGRVEIEGEGASDYLEYILPSSVKTVENGRAFYSVMCKEDGGILDDVVTDKLSPSSYIMVVNAANREKDLEWLNKKSHEFNIKISDQSNTSSLVALQGPRSKEILQKLCDIDLSKLKRFRFLECKVNGDDCLVSRTGYTGEDGYEILLRDSPLDNPTRTV